jgi:dihydroorotate dehydrogenase
VLYRLFFTHVLRRVDAERAHHLAARTMPLLARRRRSPPPELRVRALGLEFPSPLGVPAGLDKDATWFEALGALGFGFVEVGTATALPQPGNPRPRILRLPRDRALWNAMGFPNAGAEAIAERLRARSGKTIVAANVGKSKAASLEQAGDDYRASVRAVAPYSDFIVLNVSSPNTPGLRDMQNVERLRELVAAARAETAKPLLVKIAPDLADEDVDAIADLALELELDGIVATNTTLSRAGLSSEAPAAGGISGAPLKRRSLAVLQRLRARVGDRLVLVSVGGVETADDVWERILAGATLVQAFTGFVYGGPLWPRRVNRDLLRRLQAAGASSIQDMIGAECRASGGSPPSSTRSIPAASPTPTATESGTSAGSSAGSTT